MLVGLLIGFLSGIVFTLFALVVIARVLRGRGLLGSNSREPIKETVVAVTRPGP